MKKYPQTIQIVTAGVLGLASALLVMILLYVMATDVHGGKSIFYASGEAILLFIIITFGAAATIASGIILACLKKDAWQFGPAISIILTILSGITDVLSDQILFMLVICIIAASLGLAYSYNKPDTPPYK